LLQVEQVLSYAIRCDRLRASMSIDTCRTRFRQANGGHKYPERLTPCHGCRDGAARCGVNLPEPLPGRSVLTIVNRRTPPPPPAPRTIECARCHAIEPKRGSSHKFCAACGPINAREKNLARANTRYRDDPAWRAHILAWQKARRDKHAPARSLCCEQCSALVTRTGWRQRVCKSCARQRARDRQRVCYWATRQPKPCKRCQTLIPAGKQWYCSACADARRNEQADRARARAEARRAQVQVQS
jgi:hypothetical protein